MSNYDLDHADEYDDDDLELEDDEDYDPENDRDLDYVWTLRRIDRHAWSFRREMPDTRGEIVVTKQEFIRQVKELLESVREDVEAEDKTWDADAEKAFLAELNAMSEDELLDKYAWEYVSETVHYCFLPINGHDEFFLRDEVDDLNERRKEAGLEEYDWRHVYYFDPDLDYRNVGKTFLDLVKERCVKP